MNRSSLIHKHPKAFKALQEVCEVGLLFREVMVTLFFSIFYFFLPIFLTPISNNGLNHALLVPWISSRTLSENWCLICQLSRPQSPRLLKWGDGHCSHLFSEMLWALADPWGEYCSFALKYQGSICFCVPWFLLLSDELDRSSKVPHK